MSEDKVPVHNICDDISSIKPNIGSKVEYARGNASGSVHNVRRSLDNAAQLSRIGIHDNIIGREIVEASFKNAFNSNIDLIMNSAGSTKVYTLIVGPGGFLGMESVWTGSKLVTFIFFGG